MNTPQDLTRVWSPEASTPALGQVLLGAVGATHGDLPDLRLRPAGGDRVSTRPDLPGVTYADVDEQLRIINPSATEATRSVGFPDATRAVIVLVDGMGWHNLQARADLAPFLTSTMTARIGQSTTPSTTSANVTYLGTGVRPGQTAMAGYTVRNPATGRQMNLISWAGGPDPLDWQRVPTVFERMAEGGIPAAHVSTWRFETSELTRAGLRGARYVAAESLEERVDETARIMNEGAVRVAYMYWADVDAKGHQHGWRSSHWEEELSAVDTQIARLAGLLPDDTLLVVTADHGMVDVPQGDSQVFGGPARIDIAEHSDLADGVQLVAGENRFLHLFSSSPGAVAARWRAHFGQRAVVRTREEVFSSGDLGPVRADVADVVGDVTVALLGDLSVGDRRIMSEAMFALPGLHGSLTMWERAIPILTLLT